MCTLRGWYASRVAPQRRIAGTSNRLQVLRCKAHGFTNYANFEARGLLRA